jgi:hypothetical protein
MATTTTNYGFDIPQSTDLVKDGATAIATLGQDIDTAMNTALGTKKAGMVLLSSVAFSAVASQAVNSVFSATYRNYLIQIDLTAVTSDGEYFMKLRSGVTDNSTTYRTMYNVMTQAGVASNYAGDNITSGFKLGTFDVGTGTHFYSNSVQLFRPFEAVSTTGLANLTMVAQDGSNVFGGAGGMVHNITTSFDGFNIIASAGNITGAINVYGFNQ